MNSPDTSSSETDSTAIKPDGDHGLTRWFTQEVHPHDGQLKSYLRGKFPSVRDVDDVVQESYLRIWKARAAKPIRSAKSFLFQIARHIAVDLLRHRQRAKTDSLRDFAALDVISEEASPLDALSEHEKISLCVAALLDLPDRCQQVFILRKFEGVPQKEIAERLEISERTVESQVTRGMKLFEQGVKRRGLDGYSRGEK